MPRDDIAARLTDLLRDFFRQPALALAEETTAADVPGWDSLAHIDLMVTIEKAFAIRLSTREVRGMKNIGALLDILAQKTA
ncbi:MAG TPA: phosphopantetheine-binding protein [Novosphingobium sp.]|nr:phosphopantetheine-binding protein [Novosphingobium sp.]HZV11394.1 phosphopantetheine-binding protein [Novosphingobium sp.]